MNKGQSGGVNAMHHMKWVSGRQQQWLRIILGAALSALPALAYGLGLGRLVVESGLDEPLRAHVRVIDVTPAEIKTLSPKLASDTYFQAAGISRHSFLSRIRYSVSQHKDGNYYIDLSTAGPFSEPFIQTMLEVDWAGGQLVREYTALLDPPNWVASQHPAISAPAVTALAAPAASVPVPSAESLPPVAPAAGSTPAALPSGTVMVGPASAPAALLGPASASQPAAPSPAPPTAVAAGNHPAWASTARYTVRKGDTLSLVARRITVDRSISPEQVMIALLQANPQAFFDHNINNLKSGKILKVPPRSQVTSVSDAQALKDFRLQYDAWQEYKLKLAAASRAIHVPAAGATAPATTAAAGTPAAGKPATAATAQSGMGTKKAGAAKTATTGTASEALLRIVRSELKSEAGGAAAGAAASPSGTKKETSGERAALSHGMTMTEEQIDARQEENKELSKRLGSVGKQVRNTERMIKIDNRELALSEKQAAKPQTPAARPVVRHPIVRRPIRPFVPVQPQSGGLIQGMLSAVTGIVSGIFSNPLTLAVLVGAVVLGGGILGVYYLRRRRAKAEFEESILSGGSLAAEASSVTDSGTQTPATDTSFLSDFSQGGMGNIHTDEVDPIAEAEVYLAYGRDEQAEEILKEAVVKDPHRQELKQKLLEIYLQRNDVSAFETLAEELYAQTEGKGGRVWEKVEEMGRKISPGNPMFRGGGQPPGAGIGRGAQNGTPGTGRNTNPQMSSGTADAVAPLREPLAPLIPDEPAGIDFSAGTPAASGGGLAFPQSAAGAAASPARADTGFDMDLSAPAAASSGTSQVPETGTIGHGDSGFDLDFNLDSAPAAASGGDISFDAPLRGESTPDFSATSRKAPPVEEGLALLAESVSDSPSLQFETAGEEGADAEPQWDETTTKLDLAKAYIDMGDAEGARSILEEVMSEGSESQKTQARALSAQIA